MRVWETGDSRVIPANMVQEQDLILRVRRLNRVASPQLVVNIVLSLTDQNEGGRGLLEIAQGRLSSWAEAQGVYIAQMSNGDLFMIRDKESVPEGWIQQVISIAWPQGLSAEKGSMALLTFDLPKDYSVLREKLNDYLELSRKAITEEDVNSPFRLLQTEAARGPLTAWSTGQIEKLLYTIDVYRYVRTQPICERQADGSWTRLYDECFIGFETLRLERFPKLEMDTTSHLFLALCQALDQHLLSQLAEYPERMRGRKMFLNLSVSSITGGNFARFARSVAPEDRQNIGFELHRGDLFYDFAATENAISILHNEGFKISIDSVSPHVLPILNLQLLDVDFIKLNVSKGRFADLRQPAVQRALSLLPKEKVIFYRCDTENALLAGLTQGVTRFQGWLIDDYLKTSSAG